MKFTTWIEFEVEIECEVQPAEKQARDYPGCDRQVIDVRLAKPVELTPNVIAELIEQAEAILDDFNPAAPELQWPSLYDGTTKENGRS